MRHSWRKQVSVQWYATLTVEMVEMYIVLLSFVHNDEKEGRYQPSVCPLVSSLDFWKDFDTIWKMWDYIKSCWEVYVLFVLIQYNPTSLAQIKLLVI
jgi:hypothetical protein